MEENIVSVKIFDFRFLVDIYILRIPEHDLAIFRKYLCACYKNFVAGVAE